MEIETRAWWKEAWVEFQWSRIHVMFGVSLAEWVVGFRWSSVDDGFKCLSIYLLCFDSHIQVWPKQVTVTLPQEPK